MVGAPSIGNRAVLTITTCAAKLRPGSGLRITFSMTPPPPIATTSDLASLATKIRRHVLHMTKRAKSSHVGSSFSMAELLAVLYGKALKVDPSRLDWEERDRFILSKGHGCAGLYA